MTSRAPVQHLDLDYEIKFGQRGAPVLYHIWASLSSTTRVSTGRLSLRRDDDLGSYLLPVAG
jgi:hypothetical protein